MSNFDFAEFLVNSAFELFEHLSSFVYVLVTPLGDVIGIDLSDFWLPDFILDFLNSIFGATLFEICLMNIGTYLLFVFIIKPLVSIFRR